MAAGRPPQELHDRLERFLSARPPERREAFRRLGAALEAGCADGRRDEVRQALRLTALPDLDHTSALALLRLYRSLREEAPPAGDAVKIAILGSVTTDPLAGFIELFLFALGVDTEILEAGYGVLDQEILDRESRLHAFQPAFVFLATSWRDLRHRPGVDDDAQAVGERVASELAEWTSRWETLHERLGCQIVQNAFAPPPWRVLGNHELGRPSSLGRFVAEVNRRFHDGAPSYVTIHDVDQLAASAGRWRWDAGRFHHLAKLPCAPEYLVDYAHSVASVIAASLGKAKKCLVLDLDDTLWGGLIGEDGLGGIRLGQGDAESEAFVEFQRYARELRQRGVILAVCSANDDRVAREPFEQHPEMVLRLDDISCFVANWQDKATNLRAIAEELGIGLDSFVFLDDDPAQRALVRRLVPEVAVPEVPSDPSAFVEIIERRRFFQVVSVGAEDLRRTELYQANTERARSQVAAASLEDFLASLEMTARIEPVHEGNLERSTQLINKTNQFNLNGRRWSTGDMLAVARAPARIACL